MVSPWTYPNGASPHGSLLTMDGSGLRETSAAKLVQMNQSS